MSEHDGRYDRDDIYDRDDDVESSAEAEAVDRIRRMPLLSDVGGHEPGALFDPDAFNVVGRFLGAVMSRHADEHVAARAGAQRAAVAAHLPAVCDVLFFCVRVLEGDQQAIDAFQNAYPPPPRPPPDLVTPRRARLVELIEDGTLASAASGGADSEEWLAVMHELRELDPALRASADEVLAVYLDAATRGTVVSRTAARISVRLNMFGDRTRLLVDAGIDIEDAITTVAKTFKKAFGKPLKSRPPSSL
jgi:hypothetical protein